MRLMKTGKPPPPPPPCVLPATQPAEPAELGGLVRQVHQRLKRAQKKKKGQEEQKEKEKRKEDGSRGPTLVWRISDVQGSKVQPGRAFSSYGRRGQ